MSRILGRSARKAVDAEVRHHIQECTELLEARGWDPEEARREAERRFGDLERIRGELLDLERREEGMRMMERVRSVVGDVAYAMRGLRAHAAFTAAVVATLALGIGAAASIFAVADAMLIRPLPYQDVDRWVEVNQATEGNGYFFGLGTSRIPEWQEAAGGLLDGWVAYARENLVRTDGGDPHSLETLAVTPGADTLLRIPLLMGRGFTSDDARPGARPVAVLGRAYWERLGADPGLLGRTMRLESGPVTVVGVLRGGTKFPQAGREVEVWLPLRTDFTFADREIRSVQGLWARLPEAMSPEVAQERVDVIAEALMEQSPSERTWRVRLVPLDAHRGNRDVRQAIWTLAGTVGAIFLIALVNGVNLLMVRASGRTREIAVRTAIGASRSRIFRQLGVEGLVLGLVGGVAAVALAWGAVAALGGILPSEVVYFSPHAFQVEGRTLAFAFMASLGAGAVLGLLPGLQALRRDVLPGSTRGREGSDGPRSRRLRNVLVAAQVAVTMTLLVAAGLFVNGFSRLLAVEPGFDVERVAFGDLILAETRYPDAAARDDFARRFEEALERRPEVETVAVSTGGGFSFGVALEAEGRPVREDQPELIPHAAVSEDYFETTGMDVVAGRGLRESDAGTGNTVIDRDLARFLWGGENPVGQRFRLGEEGEWMTVVGVVEELIMMGRDERRGPYQYLTARSPEGSASYLEIAMRTAGPPEALLGIFQQTLRALDPEQSYWRLRTAADALAEEEEKARFLVTLMSLLAAIALTLAAVGLYGVLAHSVSRRSRELGIRMALGAARRRVRAMVLGEGVAVAGAGVIAGLVGALWATTLVEQLLYEVEPHDPATFAATAVLLLVVAGAASVLPARRATSVDPVTVLKSE